MIQIFAPKKVIYLFQRVKSVRINQQKLVNAFSLNGISLHKLENFLYGEIKMLLLTLFKSNVLQSFTGLQLLNLLEEEKLGKIGLTLLKNYDY